MALLPDPDVSDLIADCLSPDQRWDRFPAEVIVFDLDDTLAESKSAISPLMAQLLGRLLERSRVCIISGGRYAQFQVQVLQRLELAAAQLDRLHLMPTCGTRYYRYLDGDWQLMYSEDLSAEAKARISEVLMDGARELGLLESQPWGEIIEDRDSQITFSALGQQAPVAAKSAWDPDGSKKGRLRTYAAQRLPGLEVRSGGSTSVDVTREGIDKAYGVRKLMEQLGLGVDDLLFVGDRLQPDGNDFPVRAMGVRSIEVHGAGQTAGLLERLLELPR